MLLLAVGVCMVLALGRHLSQPEAPIRWEGDRLSLSPEPRSGEGRQGKVTISKAAHKQGGKHAQTNRGDKPGEPTGASEPWAIEKNKTTATNAPKSTCLENEEELQDYVTYFTSLKTSKNEIGRVKDERLHAELRNWLITTNKLMLESTNCTCKDVRQKIYAAQRIFNSAARFLFDSYHAPRLPVASYVYQRPDSYRQVLRRLRKQLGSDNVHLIVSMDRFSLDYLRALREEITFCTWQPIMHELDWETYHTMEEQKRLHVAVPLAFHWWWLQQTLWSRLLKGYDGDVLFVEEDHVMLSRHALRFARTLLDVKNKGISKCDTVSLSMTSLHAFGQLNPFHHVFHDPTTAVVEQPLFSNLAYAFNRTVSERLVPHRNLGLDWDWNINLAFKNSSNGFVQRHLRPVYKRVLNVDMCKPSGGIHAIEVPSYASQDYCGTAQWRAYNLSALPESHLSLPSQIDVYRFEGKYPPKLWVAELVGPHFVSDCTGIGKWDNQREACVNEETNSATCPELFVRLADEQRKGEKDKRECQPDHKRWYPYITSYSTRSDQEAR